jgi:hypothetical protein
VDARHLPRLALIVASCGGRTPLGTRGEVDAEVEVDGGADVSLDAAKDASADVPLPTCGFEGDPSPQATSSYGACGEGVNITSPPSDNCAGVGAAFEYVPQSDVLVERLELHTQQGVVALLDSDCEKPGKVLFLQPLQNPGAPTAWRGADVFPPIKVLAHHRYFIYGAPSQPCSAAVKGVEVREFTAPGPNGPWEGPFGGIAWSARILGVCP